MKIIKLMSFLFFVIFVLQNCKKKDNDFRNQYYGDFIFTSKRTFWTLEDGATISTSKGMGEIREYIKSDSENDLFTNDDTGDDISKKIMIVFSGSTKITSLIDEEGKLVTKSGSHYYHYGRFSQNNDTIWFSIKDLGGLGGGASYDVIGIGQ